jgi:hypothetical protein
MDSMQFSIVLDVISLNFENESVVVVVPMRQQVFISFLSETYSECPEAIKGLASQALTKTRKRPKFPHPLFPVKFFNPRLINKPRLANP